MYKDEFNVANFLAHPDELIGKALTLQYKPVDLDVLPLYIVLVAVAPFVVWCLVRRPNLTLAGSAVLYVLARYFDWNLPSYPTGADLVFQSVCLAVVVFLRRLVRQRRLCEDLEVPGVAHRIRDRDRLDRVCFPHRVDLAQRAAGVVGATMVDQGDLSDRQDQSGHAAAHPLPRACCHGLALSQARLGRAEVDLARPLVLCGQHSLPLFCLGVFLSFGAHWILVQWKSALSSSPSASLDLRS